MLKLIYGKDEYRAKKRLGEIIAEFLISDPNRMNLSEIDGAEANYPEIDQAISTLPFLADKRMIVIANLLTKNKDSELKAKILERIKTIENGKEAKDEIDIIFHESGEPDKRTGLFKRLSKTAELFNPLQGAELDRFIKESVSARGGKIDFSAVRLLNFGIGPDLNRLENEIGKLWLYAQADGREEITESDVDLLVELETGSNVFHFVESLAAKNTKKAPEYLYNLLSGGEPEIRVLSMIVYQYRNLIILKDFLTRGEAPAGLAAKAKMHPFVVQKTLPLLKKYSLADLIQIYSYLQEVDAKMKNGSIDQKLALDLIVAKLTG